MKFYLTKKAQLAAEGRAPKEAASTSVKAQVATAPRPADAPTVTVAPSEAHTSTSRRSGKPRSAATTPAKKGHMVVAGIPRVDLLPPEVRAERRGAVNVRRAWTGVVGLVAVMGIAGGAAALYGQTANDDLASAQAETSSLTASTAKYSEVKTTQDKVDLIDAARQVGGSTDVDWPTYLAKVQATLPDGMSLSTVTVDSASPIAQYAQATSPLQGQRVATLAFSATSTSLPAVPTWLVNLRALPGFADASAGTVSLTSGVYTANVVVHINEKAFSNAFVKKGK